MEVSKLGVPLLMVNGDFRKLNSLTVEELETFIPFMTSCSLKRGKAPLVRGMPKWWVKTIKYKFPLKKPKGLSDLGYKRHLRLIICRCYCYHDAHFLLSYSSKFSEDPQSIFFVNNKDNTTSVFLMDTTAEIFTFDNENKEYDKRPKEKPHRRSLLPAQSPKVMPQVIADIYLCENCDVEFYSLTEMRRHEKECYGTRLIDLTDDIQIISHIKPIRSPFDKNGFLDYFGLASKTKAFRPKVDDEGLKENAENRAPVKRWVTLNMCLHKNRKVEFSSALGRKMLEYGVRRDVMLRVEKSILSWESHCSTASRYQRGGKFFLRPRLTYKRKKEKWSHTYCFNKRQRLEKMNSLGTGLSLRTMNLLRKCRRCKVLVTPLQLPTADYFIVSLLQNLIVPCRFLKLDSEEIDIDDDDLAACMPASSDDYV